MVSVSRFQHEQLSCPFCDKCTITCLHIPSSFSSKTIHVGSNKKTVPKKSSEIWLIQSGCSICGKSNEEVEKELRKKGII